MEKDSVESWDRKRKEKLLEKNKRFIPDAQWKMLVGVVGSGIIIMLTYFTIMALTTMLGANKLPNSDSSDTTTTTS